MARRKRYFDYYADFTPSKPIETQDGIKSHSRRGAFAKNWWAKQWIEALERLVDSGRLSRGRTYARKGQVLSIQETKTGVAARMERRATALPRRPATDRMARARKRVRRCSHQNAAARVTRPGLPPSLR